MNDVEPKVLYREAAAARALPTSPMAMPEQTLERAPALRTFRWFWMPRATSNP